MVKALPQTHDQSVAHPVFPTPQGFLNGFWE
jgi:hypothetical protein